MQPNALYCPTTTPSAGTNLCDRAAVVMATDLTSASARSMLAECVMSRLSSAGSAPAGLGRVEDGSVTIAEARAAVREAVDRGYRMGMASCGLGIGLPWREIRRRAIRAEVAAQGGNVSAASRVLGLARSTVYLALKG